jgi:MOSC domain-containing protein YiiM
MRGTLVQVNVSNGGMPKQPVELARVTVDGLDGDWQKNRKSHGGRDRAVCLFSVELYEALKADGFELAWGSVGENFTTGGVDLQRLTIGNRLRVGPCLIEITDVRVPCRSLDKRWGKGLMKAIQARSGWVAKVVEEGEVRAGDEIEIIETRA